VVHAAIPQPVRACAAKGKNVVLSVLMAMSSGKTCGPQALAKQKGRRVREMGEGRGSGAATIAQELPGGGDGGGVILGWRRHLRYGRCECPCRAPEQVIQADAAAVQTVISLVPLLVPRPALSLTPAMHPPGCQRESSLTTTPNQSSPRGCGSPPGIGRSCACGPPPAPRRPASLRSRPGAALSST
jgi:hypothetical protein